MDPHASHGASHHPPHKHPPIDPGYRLVVRTVLWIIAGTVFVAFAVWWLVT